ARRAVRAGVVQVGSGHAASLTGRVVRGDRGRDLDPRSSHLRRRRVQAGRRSTPARPSRESRMSLYDIPFDAMDGTTHTLREHADDVVLVVNVASRCGLAPQYATLEAMQEKYRDRGFTVIGFPSNQFLQELGTNEAIQEFCSLTYGVTFPVVD